MKKITLLCLALLLALFSVFACTGDNSETSSEPPAESETSQTSSEASANTSSGESGNSSRFDTDGIESR